MKYLILLTLFISSYARSFCQTNYYGPTQIGNYNTQNNYMQPRLDKDNASMLLKFIKQMKVDSNFYDIRHFKMSYAIGSNGMQMLLDICKFLQKNGYTNVYPGTRYDQVMYTEMPEGIIIGLDKKDSTMTFKVGQL